MVFLAGPIVGAERWQDAAIAYWQQRPTQNFCVATPRRAQDRVDDFTDDDYRKQVYWESMNLRRASQTGLIMFWLAKEKEHECGRAFAQTTRFELGEWLTRAPARVMLGIEEGFTGAKYIRQRFASVSHMTPGMDQTIYNTLPDICNAINERLAWFASGTCKKHSWITISPDRRRCTNPGCQVTENTSPP